MGAVNVLLLLLVWTFTAFCKDDEITCNNVTGNVRKEITLTCRVSYPDKCDMMMYKFMNKDKDTTICREEFRSDSCQQLSFSCPYPANEVMTSTFQFFIQTTAGAKTADFTVNITEAVKEDGTGGSNRIEAEPEAKAPVQAGNRSALAVIISVLSCFTIIIMGLFLRKKHNTNTIKFQRREVCACEHTDVSPA